MEELTMFQSYQKIMSEQQDCIFFFSAEFYQPSQKGGQIYDIVTAMAQKYKTIKFYRIDAEADELQEISQLYDISMIPSFIAICKSKIVEPKVEGANPANVLELVKKLLSIQQSTSANTTSTVFKTVENELNSRLESLIKSAPVMLFMKGSPSQPKCGFSRTIVEILKTNNVPFTSFDILTDNAVREGLKVYSEWPTYPQLYVKGELIGGLDIVKELISNGETLLSSLGLDNIQDLVSSSRINSTTMTEAFDSKENLNDRLKKLINQAQVMLFMKGSPSQPKCGFSRTIVEILQNNDINFETFDILSDEEVRSGLKVYSDWPTYPQLYCKGELVGGLDIVKDMISEPGAESLKIQLGLE